MTINTGMMTSASEDWATPSELFDKINAEFIFDLDVCASESNAKCAKYFTKKDNALNLDWNGICWMNPPYGRKINAWVSKAFLESSKQGTEVVCLLPARTDTGWWSIFWDHSTHRPRRELDSVRFIKGRVRFNDAGPAPFPSAIVILRG